MRFGTPKYLSANPTLIGDHTQSQVAVSVATYGVKVNEVTKVLRSAVQGAVVPRNSLPSSVEIIRHHVDEVQIP